MDISNGIPQAVGESSADDLLKMFSETVNGPQPSTEPVVTEAQKQEQDLSKAEDDNLNDYNIALVPLKQLVSSWLVEDNQTEKNRLKRDIDIEVDMLREAGTIDDDETFIPVRVIDTNIVRETPPYINFLKNSRRIAIFKDNEDETFDCEAVERAFTKGMTYKGWIKPFYKCVDGAATHGWTSVEVTFDQTKPLHVGIEYIAHEDLIFYLAAKDIQASQDVLRRYLVTVLQLRKWVRDFGFDAEQVELLVAKVKDGGQEKDKPLTIYKGFHKKDGQVYVRWFSCDGGCTNWLKKPELLSCGISKQVQTMVSQQVSVPSVVQTAQGPVTIDMPQMQMVPSIKWQPSPLNSYPIFILPYRETEKPLLFDHLGRCYLDGDKQEAQTAITTAYVNSMNRAMKVYASPKQDDGSGRPAKQLPIKLANGTILDRPMEFWNMPYPDPSALKALQYLDNANSQEVGQVNFAANNRQDSRKTATEINAAQQESQLLDTVDLTLFSEFIRDAYSFAWIIVQSQALQNLIKFCQIKQPATQMQQQDLLTGSIVNSAGSYQDEQAMVNDVDTISRNYDVRAAGDVDVIAKDEMIQKMQRDWPVIQQTPLASRFLADYLKLVYPEDAELYSKILQSGDPKNAIIQALGAALSGIVQMPEVQHLITPQVKAQLQQLEQEASMAVNPQAQQSGSQQPTKQQSPSSTAQSQQPQSNIKQQ